MNKHFALYEEAKAALLQMYPHLSSEDCAPAMCGQAIIGARVVKDGVTWGLEYFTLEELKCFWRDPEARGIQPGWEGYVRSESLNGRATCADAVAALHQALANAKNWEE